VASGDDLAYQWYVSTDGGSNFTAISNGGVYSGVTSATLSLSSGINSSFNNYKYRVNVTNTCDNIGVTSSIVGLTIYSSAYVNITSQPASVTVTQGSSTSFSVVGEGPGLLYQWKSSSDNVNFTNISGATNSTYRPSTSNIGYYYFSVDLKSNSCSGSATQTSNKATLWVKSFNQNLVDPVGENDTNSDLEDVSSITGNVLTNDSDPTGDALLVTQFVVSGLTGTFTASQTATIASVGSLQINADGTYTFVPVANYNGTVPTATYTISDSNGGTATATLIISISAVNDIPVGVNDTNISLEDVSSMTGNVLTNDFDSEGDALLVTQFTVTGLSGTFSAGQTATIVSVGTLKINANGIYTFVAIANYNGRVPTATYTISDGGGGTAMATLIMSISAVNDIPIAMNDTNSSLEDVSSITGNVLTNDSDSDGDALSTTQFVVAGLSGTFTAGQTATFASVGTVKINANGTYTFIPVANYNGTVPTMTYSITDSYGGTATATLIISISAVNDNPVAVDDNFHLDEYVSFASNVLTNDSDSDGDTLSVTQFVVAGLSSTFIAGQTATIASVGTLKINANGTFTFIPVNTFGGNVPKITYTVMDPNNGTAIAILTMIISVDSDGDGTPDHFDPAPYDGCIWDPTQRSIPKSIAWKAADCDGDGNPNGTDKAPLDFCVGGLSGAVPAINTAQYKFFASADCDNDGISNAMECFGGGPTCQDFDFDGIPNYLDSDSDNDGLLDSYERNIDSDKDGDADYLDLDSDNDGILDRTEGSVDADGDGIANYLDLDSDGDGILDAWEASEVYGFHSDYGYTGTVKNADGSFPDVNVNGLADFLETSMGGKPRGPQDTDKDGIPDFLDWDSDGDGIPDIIEQTSDMDKDYRPNYRDVDSDGDLISDNKETSADADGDGSGNYLDLDSDGDGIPDRVEGVLICEICPSRDDQPDGMDDRSNGIPVDTDKDGKPDYLDTDSDNDGIPDSVEAGKDPSKPVDTDGDGIPDFRDTDSDNDGIPDSVEAGKDPSKPVDTDGDGKPDYQDTDSDNDGIPDKIEAGKDPSKPVDTDGDGKPDYQDTDSDNDGIPDSVEAGKDPNKPVDTDGDGKPDYQDLDSDGDGIPDSVEAGKDPNKPVDTDGDGKPDYLDTDSDNDGIPDSVEAGKDPSNPVDTDGDGKPDYQETDSDNDGIPDSVEAGKDPSKPVDTDGDGKPDYQDTDSDNDGIPDSVEAGKDPQIPIDTDRDGKPDYQDTDSDNDGIPDAVEAGNVNNPVDTDGDGKPDYQDTDSDNDGIPDKIEAGADPTKPVDTDADGTPDYRDLDSDNDGYSDKEEAGKDPSNPVDTDKDGKPDYQDTDSDNDGILDKLENDINYGALTDCDKDGVDNRIDADQCPTFAPNGISPNGDGKNDVLIIPGILRNQPNELTIFNRWGNIVYQTSNYKNDWGGQTDRAFSLLAGDNLLPDGTYYYVIDFFGKYPNVGTYVYINRQEK
jgi:gliding motility-associated-like protein